ncbi:MAG: hydrogenase [Candidatus Nezhaarchaeota archaeon]|nr:hydrogenase [Candidatus Nezhaarchaeota archaeon]MCX8141411.1 hydrogenase [Candidatus Nezhaarchaeota archaeon]MDW8049677.1 hydrogenase [Nitrososphaerota archaeon]
MASGKVKVGFYSLTGCAGDLLNILGMEDKLVEIFGNIDLMEFVMASSRVKPGKVDIAFVEGSVTTKKDLETIKRIRENCSKLVAIGDCAIWGGLQASLTGLDPKELMKAVYNTEENYYEFLGEHKALSEIVQVDYELPGCPIEQDEFLQLLIDLLRDVIPEFKDYPVCVECKIREIPCLIVEKGEACLGPITVGGCKARCPYYEAPCISCRGPIKDEANVAGELLMLLEKGWKEQDVVDKLRLFAARYKDISKLIRRV